MNSPYITMQIIILISNVERPLVMPIYDIQIHAQIGFRYVFTENEVPKMITIQLPILETDLICLGNQPYLSR